jgi:3-hydroxyacyl-CoA dehydrogenase / enoyl-CoA hydratase / 3-hydroxybutyryl-CoA epimerase
MNSSHSVCESLPDSTPLAVEVATRESVELSMNQSIATILLGQPEEVMITLSLARLESLETILEQLEHSVATGEVQGIVLRSPTPRVFCAGADLKLLQRIQAGDLAAIHRILSSSRLKTFSEREFLDQLEREQLPALGTNLAMRGQAIFTRLQQLKVRKVAAISGRCLGGGLELALHCDYLVAASEESLFAPDCVTTELGFPEPLLGLLEAWGGTELIPRRIGLPAALTFLLNGKPMGPMQALQMGLVDHVVPRAELVATAEAIAKGEITPHRKFRWGDYLLTHTALGRHCVCEGLSLPFVGRVIAGAKSNLAAFPPEHYPAPHAIVATVQHGLGHGVEAGGKRAAGHFGELMVSPTAKALTHVMFQGTEAAKVRGRNTTKPLRSLRCLVVGAGQMGAGIALAFARGGHRVCLVDSQAQAVERARHTLEKAIHQDRRLSADDRAQILRDVAYSQAFPDDLPDVDIAIEAVFESVAIKREVLAAISAHVSETTIIATNTSSIPLTQLQSAVQKPERFLGVHFFNPVHKMKLVEIIKGEVTQEVAVNYAAACVGSLGKYPIVVRDVPGFLMNRILFPYIMEAFHLVCEGVPIPTIDRAAESFGMVMGPLRTLDLVGLDIVHDIAQVLQPVFANRNDDSRVPAMASGTIPWDVLLKHCVAERLLGRKTKAGFYVYAEGSGMQIAREQANPRWWEASFWSCMGTELPSPNPLSENMIAERLVLSLVNEAVRAHDEGIAGSPGLEAALQIDLGSVLGFGFAPFRGGVLYYAQERGLANVLAGLEQLEHAYGKRWQPWPGITERVRHHLSLSELPMR